MDGAEVARAFLNPIISDTAGYYMLSIDTIQQLEPGKIVSTIWVPDDAAYLWSYSDAEGGVTHFTGQLLGSSTA